MPSFDLFRIRSVSSLIVYLLAVCVIATPAYAVERLGDMTDSLYTSFLPAQAFISSIIFILGLWYVYQGIQSMRASGEGGQNAPPLSKSLFKLGGGAALVSLPFIAMVVINSVTNESGMVASLVTTSHTFNQPGLDHALGRFVTNFFGPFMSRALPYFCYMAGLILIIRGVQRLANGDGKGPTAPGGFGTSSIFLVGALLMSLGYFMGILEGSIFGDTNLYGDATLVDQSALSKRAENVLWAIFQFLRIVGYITVIRGLFQMKTFADGGQASLLGATTHIISGAMLANVWYFIWVVQNTFISDCHYFIFNSPTSGTAC